VNDCRWQSEPTATVACNLAEDADILA